MDPGAAGFSHSPFMRFLGLEIIKAEKGRVEIRDASGTLVAVGRACYASPRPPKETTS